MKKLNWYMDVEINIEENGNICWLKNMYEQMKSKYSCNGNDIVLYKELLGYTSQDVDTLED